MMNIKQKTSLEVLEKKVTLFLQQYAKDTYAKEIIAPHVAKTSLKENHLYEDLGFLNRTQMGNYMKSHFPLLSELKPKEKLWKKFIYESIDEVAPACEYCQDQENCFSCIINIQ